MSEVVVCSKLEQQMKDFAIEHHLDLEICGLYEPIKGPRFRHDAWAWEYNEKRDATPDSAKQVKALIETNFPVKQWVYVDEAPFAPEPKPKADPESKPKAPETTLDFDAKPFLEVLLGLAVIAASAVVAAVVMAVGFAIAALAMADPKLVAYIEVAERNDKCLAVVVAKWAH